VRLGHFSADDLAQLFATTRNYVLKKASTGQWERIHHPTRGRLYLFEDAEKDLGPGSKTRHLQLLYKRKLEEDAREYAAEVAEYLKVYGEIPDWARPDTPHQEQDA
jgi:hypothetical protein